MQGALVEEMDRWLGKKSTKRATRVQQRCQEQLLRVACERRVVGKVERLQVDVSVAVEHRSLDPASHHIGSLVNFMELAGWVEWSTTVATPWAFMP